MTRGHARPHRGAGRLLSTLVVVGALLAGLGIWGIARAERATSPGDGCLTTTARLAPRCGAWWGAYVPYAKNGSLTEAVHAFESRIGRTLDLVYTYHDMSRTRRDGELLTPDERELGRHRLLMLAWESTIWTKPHHQDYTETQLGWAKVAAGDYDRSIVDPQAERIKAYGRTVFLSFDQETDFRTPDAGTPAQFVAAYRHLHDRFERLGVHNVVWVWTVSGFLGHADLMERLYPGDGYVDWIGMDQYNYYLCHQARWLDFRASQRPTYDWLRKHISATKPIMLSEFSSAPDLKAPTRQRDWYERIPAVVPSLPHVKALVQWDSPIPGPDCDLTVDRGAALAGYRVAGQADYFNQSPPNT